jgi:TonB-dependent receptor
VSPNDILDGDRSLWTRQWFVASRDFLMDHTGAVRQLFGRSPNEPPNDPNRFFENQEDTYAAYAQARFGFDMGAVPVDGIFGARFVQTKSTIDGFLPISATAQVPVEIDQDEDYLLPSLNVRWKFTDELHLRFAASQTVARPRFADLNPGTTRTAPGITLPGQGSGGDPFLKNPEGTNADLSLEWYFAPTASLTGGLFYRDIKNYIQVFTNEEIIGGGRYNISRPRNTDAELQGLELAYTQFFDMLPGWASGFGLQLNYTLVDSSARTPDLRADPTGQTFVEADVTNVSDDAYNVIAIYEKYGVSARLAYNWRSDYIESYNQSGAQPPAVVVKDAAQMDFSLGYDITESITVSLDATNILDKPVLNYFGSRSDRDAYLYPRDVRSNDRTLALGVRIRL